MRPLIKKHDSSRLDLQQQQKEQQLVRKWARNQRTTFVWLVIRELLASKQLTINIIKVRRRTKTKAQETGNFRWSSFSDGPGP